MSARKMKDSGIEWIGEIPEEWQATKLFNLLEIIGGGTTPKDKTLLEDEGDIPWLNTGDLNDGYIYDIKRTVKKEALDEYSALKIFEAEAIVIAMYGATIGKLGIATDRFTTNQACCVLVVGEELEHKFLFYSLMAMRENIIALALGGGQPNISQDIVKSLRVPLPPLAEQKAIAIYLNEKCAAIDKIVASKQKQNEQLAEYRQSLITEAVTKGLNSSAPMQDSGIEWIRETPEEWQIKKVKHIFSVVNGATPKSSVPEYWDGDIMWITPADMSFEMFEIKDSRQKITAAGLASCGTTLVPKGSIVISTRAPIGQICIAGKELCTNQGCKTLVCFEELCNEYFYYYLKVQAKVLNMLGRGTTFLELSSRDLGDFLLPLPPFAEQKAIAAYLDKKCGDIDALREHNKNIIESLQEYKQSLIYEAVTGKIEL